MRWLNLTKKLILIPFLPFLWLFVLPFWFTIGFLSTDWEDPEDVEFFKSEMKWFFFLKRS